MSASDPLKFDPSKLLPKPRPGAALDDAMRKAEQRQDVIKLAAAKRVQVRRVPVFGRLPEVSPGGRVVVEPGRTVTQAAQEAAAREALGQIDFSEAIASGERKRLQLQAASDRRARAMEHATLVAEIQRLRAINEDTNRHAERSDERADRSDAALARGERRQQVQLSLTASGVLIAGVALLLTNHVVG
jgi:hypothetical protein